ncbi:MAG: hypothetical protein C4293_20140, partial [Nitrospiraceae bacterium]
EAACNEVKDVLGLPPERVARIPLLMAPPRSYLCREPAQLPALTRRPLFLCVAQLIPRKNIGTLLTAAKLVKEEGLEFSVWIAGTGPLADELVSQRDRLELQDVVEFLGPIQYSSIGFAYEACDVYVLPTHYDYRSISVLEAMRFGKPILDSRGDGSAGDLIRHGLNGFIFDPTNPKELAEQMSIMIQQPDLRRRMGESSAKDSEVYSHEVSARELARLIGRCQRDG